MLQHVSHCSAFASPGWAHVVCALYIPEVQFANVLTMEPIVLQYVPHDRFNKVSPPCSLPAPSTPTLLFFVGSFSPPCLLSG